MSTATADARSSADLKASLALRFDEMRERTLLLVDPLSDEDLHKAHEPTMGPIAWDLGHIPSFEELWLVHGVRSREEQLKHYDETFDAEKQSRSERAALELPTRAESEETMRAVRARMLATLQELDFASQNRVVRGGFAHEMILQHEAQHQENLLVTTQMIPGRYVPSIRVEKPAAPPTPPRGMVKIDGGPFRMGADLAPGVYDNEAPAHEVDVPTFWLDAAPVTNADYLAFMESGGYDDPAHWSEDGWDMRLVHKWSHPKYWSRNDAGEWFVREMDRVLPLPPTQPVVHVSWFEAEAFATWAGKRLPTEAEWEKAASWDPASGTKRRYPWGDPPWTPTRANLDQVLFGPAPIGAYPEGVSAYGCHQLVGDAWEWTADDLHPHPGFEAFPYDQYSTPFFDRGFKVLKGGSWATRPHVARATFRNWHQQDHQQIFAGFRCASSRAPREAGHS